MSFSRLQGRQMGNLAHIDLVSVNSLRAPSAPFSVTAVGSGCSDNVGLVGFNNPADCLEYDSDWS